MKWVSPFLLLSISLSAYTSGCGGVSVGPVFLGTESCGLALGRRIRAKEVDNANTMRNAPLPSKSAHHSKGVDFIIHAGRFVYPLGFVLQKGSGQLLRGNSHGKEMYS